LRKALLSISLLVILLIAGCSKEGIWRLEVFIGAERF